MRVNNRGEACYSSFEELAAAWKCKPVSRVTKDKQKLAEQQKRFAAKHKCRACGQPMTWLGGNMLTCCNPECKGIKVTKEDEEGNKKVFYLTSYDLLDDIGSRIAENIYSAEI